MTVDEIRSYLRMFDAGHWTQLNVGDDGDFLRVSRLEPPPRDASVTLDVPRTTAPARVTVPSPSIGVIRQSVGRSASVGDLVAADQSLANLEIGDRNHPIVSPVAGTLVEACVVAGDTVEFGDVLFAIQP